mmetsp:Transcript_6634/g.7223  ORF Transcript_6634/g.7223 Transcript_6634/m.7223 type:complete len:251 (+) Transcript_6634:321-1073(+)
MKGGELFDCVLKNGPLPEAICRLIIHDICKALSYLHDQGIAHRDLKPENVLFAEEYDGTSAFTVKIIDFGFAKIDREHGALQTPIGTAAYVAPEVIHDKQYDKKVDMWSLGCLLYFVLFGRPPFYSEDEEEICDLAKKGNYSIPKKIKVSTEALDFVRHLLEPDPTKRFVAKDALQHKWLKGSSDMEVEPSKVVKPKISEKEATQMKQSFSVIDRFREPEEDMSMASAQDSPLWKKRQLKKQKLLATGNC